MNIKRWGQLKIVVVAMAITIFSDSVFAVHIDLPAPNDDKIEGTLNTTLTAGVGIRMQGQSTNLIGKANLNPNVCTGPNGAYQSCQGLFKDQFYPQQILVNAPGAASMNGDDGDLNYNKGSVFQAVAKVTSDLTLQYGDFGMFARVLYFYDAANNNLTEYHPDRITPENYLQVGRHVSPASSGVLSGLSPTQIVGCLANPSSNILCPGSGALQAAFLNNRNYGRPDGHGNFIVYGPGGVVRNKRNDAEVLRQAGTNLQFLDSYIFGKLPIPFLDDKEFSFKLGRQTVNWGESTTIVINSINQANPVNANNYYRVGNQVEEDFVPINMLDVSFHPFENASIETFYQFEWQPVEAPAPGTYFSDVDLGTKNAGRSLNVNSSFGGAAEDPNSLGGPLDNPLAAATPTSATLQRLPDLTPRTSGQYGIKLDYFADWLNNGTDLSLYYMNYHSRLPYASFFAAYPSCARREGNALGNDANSGASFLSDCSMIPLVKGITGSSNPATSSVTEFDSVRMRLEYPEDIHLIGASFNTIVGGYSIQGEVAYRPNMPLQVDTQDLAFAALGPTLTRCHDPKVNCAGSTTGIGFTQNGGTATYGSSNFTPAAGRQGYADTFDLLAGALDGSARSFPNFVVPYRGGTVGENTPCYPKAGSPEDIAANMSGFSHPYYEYNSRSPCYIRGYERMQVFQFNLEATQVLGASDNLIGASQVIWVIEAGSTYVPNMPSLDRLVLEGPNTNYGPTAGADGSGADGSRRACSTSQDCSIGPDGLRFNPHQQDPAGYPTPFSWGYRLISIVKYESVLPGLSISPTVIFKHDVAGTAPSPAPNFVSGRKEANVVTEFRYLTDYSFNLGYTWFWGAGSYNTLSDRDYAQAYFKYQF